MLEDSCFYYSVSAETVTVPILKYASFHSICCLMNWKVNLLNEQRFYRDSIQCQKLEQVFEVQSFGLDVGPQSFCQYSFIALPIIHWSQPRNLLFGCVLLLLLLWKPRSWF